jgi:hypothetical protein
MPEEQKGSGSPSEARFLLFVFDLNLPPVSLDEYPSVVVMNPVMWHPHRVLVRRTLITSRNPDVAGTVPAMVAGDPNIPTLRGRAWMFNDCHRWSNMYIYLGVGSRRKHRADCKQSCECNFLQVENSFRSSRHRRAISLPASLGFEPRRDAKVAFHSDSAMRSIPNGNNYLADVITKVS